MDAMSKRFVDALRKRAPDLIEHVRESPNQQFIELRIDSPSGHGELLVSTEREEVFVAFACWSGYFKEQEYWVSGLPDEVPQGEAFEQPLTLIADLLRDLVVILVLIKNGNEIRTGPSHLWWSTNDLRYEDADHYYMLSWSGLGDVLPPEPIILK